MKEPITPTSLEGFYKDMETHTGEHIESLLPEGIQKEIGHFNVFSTGEMRARFKQTGKMPYNRRDYYKISSIAGRNKAEYADREVHIEKHALLFATPRIPYHWIPLEEEQAGDFCIFTSDFLAKNGVLPEDFPIFKPGGYPIFELSEEDAEEVSSIFQKMHREIATDYAYKYDLLRNYVMELIHLGQKLQPAASMHSGHHAAARVSSLFIELLERQFPIESVHQRLTLRAAGDYAERLSVHVNHLNKVLKEQTGKTTTVLIAGRIVREAKILLKQTDWSVSEIAYCLGFEETSHFSNFFRKQAGVTPMQFRS